jgi:hypothetical protein
VLVVVLVYARWNTYVSDDDDDDLRTMLRTPYRV